MAEILWHLHYIQEFAYILSIIQNDSYIFSQINHSESIISFNHSFKSMILIIKKSIISLSNQSMKIDHLKSIFDTLSLMDNESIHVSILTFKWHQLMMFVSTDIGYLWLRFNYMLRISVPSVVAKILTSLHLNLGGTVAIWDWFPRTFVPWNSLGNDRSAPRMCKLVEEFSSEFPSEEGTSGSSENNQINTRTPTDCTFLKTGSRRLASCLLFETAWEWNLFSCSPQPRDLFLHWSSSGNRRYSTCVKMSAAKLKRRKCLEVWHS